MSSVAHPPHPPSSGRRLLVLDVLRGIVICGSLFAGISAFLPIGLSTDDLPSLPWPVEDLLFEQRLLPIFALLFGISFGIIWGSAERRAAHPRVVMLRRLLALALFGGALLPVDLGGWVTLSLYAIAGLVFLLPATAIPDRHRARVCAILGVVLLVPGAYAGEAAEIPGLFLIGLAVAHSGLVSRFEDSARPGLTLAVPATVLAAIFIPLQVAHPETAGDSPVGSIAGLATAAAVVGLVAAALQTPLRRTLGWFFAPLGRMALSNYVGATLVATVAHLILYPQLDLDFFTLQALAPEPHEVATIPLPWAWAGCTALLAIQSLLSRAWLSRFSQGPLERLWHVLTWAGAASRGTTADRVGPDVGQVPVTA